MSSPITLSTSDFDSWHEAKIWINLKEGDKRALSYVYTKYFDKLYSYGSRFTADKAFTEDCIQDLFVELWNRREGLGDVINIKYYLFKSLRRKIIYKLELQARRPETGELTSFEIELSDKTHYLNQEITNDIMNQLRQLVLSLTPKQKEAVFLIYYDQLSYEEVASIMCLKIKTVYNLINLAIGKLREQKGVLVYHDLWALLIMTLSITSV